MSQVIAAAVYWPLARLPPSPSARALDVAAFPLSFYRDRSFYMMRTDALDRFGTRLEQRFTARADAADDGGGRPRPHQVQRPRPVLVRDRPSPRVTGAVRRSAVYLDDASCPLYRHRPSHRSRAGPALPVRTVPAVSVARHGFEFTWANLLDAEDDRAFYRAAAPPPARPGCWPRVRDAASATSRARSSSTRSCCSAKRLPLGVTLFLAPARALRRPDDFRFRRRHLARCDVGRQSPLRLDEARRERPAS